MTMDRIDWQREVQGRATSDRAKRDMAGLDRLRQAAVPAEKLMNDEHWRIYQQMLQGAIEQQVANRDRLLIQLMSDRCSSYEDMTRVKRLIAECEAMIQAWNAAIDLPTQLLQNAARAAEELAKVTERFDKPKEPTYGAA